MESWGDCSPRGGVRGLMQPVVRPLGDSKHFGEVLIELSRTAGNVSSRLAGFGSYYEFIVDAWRGIARAVEPGKPFRTFWEDALRKGGHFESLESHSVRLAARASSFAWRGPLIESIDEVQSRQSRDETEDKESATMVVYPSQIHYDGRGANKPWLQELQDPVLQNVWGNYIEVSRTMAERMGVETGDVLKVVSPYSSIDGPAHVSRRLQGDVVAVSMGQGHTRYGKFQDKIGVNPVRLLPWSFDEMSGQGAYLTVNVKLEKTGRRDALPTPEGNPYDEGRGIAGVIGLGALRDLTREEQHELPHDDEEEFEELLSPHDHPRHRWGMVIDLNACNGCGACVTACYAENNIPVVGREQYAKGREMTWMRVERYYTKGQPDEVVFVPMLCQQCDNAPCETVCPVYATYHTPEGLNAQIYNRCVGTRYCANNCPYAVRRFNWFAYKFPEPLNQQLNPNVTVRSKGVMEKCSFCVQRIAAARGKAKDEKRPIRDGEIITACSQTCPTGAITFGDLKDPDSAVSRKSRDARGYKILEHINTKPSVTYLKKISGREYIG